MDRSRWLRLWKFSPCEAWEMALSLAAEGALNEIALGAVIAAMGTRWKEGPVHRRFHVELRFDMVWWLCRYACFALIYCNHGRTDHSKSWSLRGHAASQRTTTNLYTSFLFETEHLGHIQEAHGRTGLFYRRPPCPNPRPAVAGGNSTCPASSRKMPRNNPTKPWQMYRPAALTPRTDLGGKSSQKWMPFWKGFTWWFLLKFHLDLIFEAVCCFIILIEFLHPALPLSCWEFPPIS